MMIRILVLLAILTAASSPAIAQSSKRVAPEKQGILDTQGTPQEQAACRPDVRRFCHALKPEDGNGSFLACLKEHREKLSKACLAVLESHWQ
jgi:hypothetical protein